MSEYKNIRDMSSDEVAAMIALVKATSGSADSLWMIERALSDGVSAQFRYGDGVDTIYSIRFPSKDSND
jgi:hypothetical protein